MPDNSVKDKLVTLEALKLVNDIKLPLDISELDSVPNEVSVTSTDVIAMQVDGSTYKVPVSALASALKATGNYITSSEVANDLTTSTAGKVLDARQGAAIKNLIDSLDLSDVSEAHENASWKSAPIGMSHYYYDEVGASTTYGVPVDNCFVVVMRSDGSGSQSRGVALAFRWTRGSTATTSSNDIWMSTLQDEESSTDVDWFAWTQISYDTLPVNKGGTNATTTAAALSNLGAVSKTGDTMTGALSVNSSNAIQLRLGQGGSYNSQVAVRAYANNTSSRTDFIQIGSNGTNYEYYSLPSTQASVSSNTQYYILTTKTPVTIEQGGTGSATASGALSNLGGVLKTGDTMTGKIVYKTGLNLSSPTTTSQEFLSVTDKNNAKMAMIRSDTNANGIEYFQIGAVRDVSGTSKYSLLKFGISSTGESFYETTEGVPFRNPVTLGLNSYIQKISSDIDVAVNPSAVKYMDTVLMRDKNNKQIGLIGATQQTNGVTSLRILCSAYNTSGTLQSSKGISIYNNRSGTATYAVDNKANFRDAIGIKYLNTSLNFTAYSSGSYADYDFGASVYVLGASIVANRTNRITSFSRVSGYTTWTFQLNSTSALNNVSVDITYIVIN